MEKMCKKIASLSLILILFISLMTPMSGILRAETNNTVADSVTGYNWMSKISDDRFLNEINIPGSHDATMWNPWNSGYIGKFTKKYAKTQGHSLNEQMLFGNRMFDIRMASKIDADKEQNDAYCVHGKEINFFVDLRYYAIKDTTFWGGEQYYMVSDVLNDVTAFLKEHPTETILLELGYESDSSDEDKTYSRAQALLNTYKDKVNPSTGKPYIYQDKVNESTYITHMPTFGDVRGQIVILSKNTEKLGYGIQYSAGNGWTSGHVAGVPFKYENHYEADKSHKKDYLQAFYGLGQHTIDAWPADEDTKAYQKETINSEIITIPLDAETHLNNGFITCTSSNVAWADWKKLGDSPKDVADLINLWFYGDSSPIKEKGFLYGWIYSDFVTADTSRRLYLTNFPDDLQYKTITYNLASVTEAEEGIWANVTRMALKGEKMTIDGSLSLPTVKNKSFIGWKLEDDTSGKIYKSGETITVKNDITLLPVYEMTWDSFNRYISQLSESGSSHNISIDNDIAATKADSSIVIPQDVTINLELNGHTIDGNGSSSTNRSNFTVYGTLNITDSGNNKGAVKGGQSTKGGGFYVAEGGTLTLGEGVNVEDNKANNGGGVYLAKSNYAKNAKLVVNGANIKNNLAGSIFGNGGGIYAGKGSQIELDGKVTVSDNERSTYTSRAASNVYMEEGVSEPPIKLKSSMDSGSTVGLSVNKKDVENDAVAVVCDDNSGLTIDSCKSCFRSDNVNYIIGKGTGLHANYLVIGNPDRNVTVTFDSNGGSAIQDKTVRYGKTVTKPTNPTKDGYTFVNWSLDGRIYDFNDPVTGNITLMANWVSDRSAEAQTKTVTFNSQGGSTVEKQSVIGKQKAYIPDNPTYENHTFKGWYTKPECTDDSKYNFNKDVTEDITLYAGWDSLYTITFDSNGGSGVEPKTGLSYNDYVNLNDDRYKSTREGYTFDDWYIVLSDVTVDEAKQIISDNPKMQEELWIDNNKVYIKSDGYLYADDDYTLKARWKAEECTVRFHDLDDNNQDVVVKTQTVKYGDKVEEPDTPYAQEWEFDSWCSSLDPAIEYDFDKTVTGNLDLYATWEPAFYAVVFDGNGARNTPEQQYIQYGESASKPKTNPVRSGYNFRGWGILITDNKDAMETLREEVAESQDAEEIELLEKVEYHTGGWYYPYDFASEKVYYDQILTAMWDKNKSPSPSPSPTPTPTPKPDPDDEHSDNVIGIDEEDGLALVVDEVVGDATVVPMSAITKGVVYRLYDASRGEHFFTKSVAEALMLISRGWIHEMYDDFVVVNAEDVDAVAVYRLYNPNDGGMHFYTQSSSEARSLMAVGWSYEGISHYVYKQSSDKGVDQYRLYNPGSRNGEHHWTSNEDERNMLKSLGWIDEGVGWKIFD